MIRLSVFAIAILGSPCWAEEVLFDPMKMVSGGSAGEDIARRLAIRFKTLPEIRHYDSPDILRPVPFGPMTSLMFHNSTVSGNNVPFFIICDGDLVSFSAPMSIDETLNTLGSFDWENDEEMSTKVDQIHSLPEEEYLYFEEVDLAVFRHPATASPMFEVTFPHAAFFDKSRLRQVCDFDGG